MPYINLEGQLPGITGLLEFRRDTAEPIRGLTQVLLRGPSTLTEMERELIATRVSAGNHCTFCATAHKAAVAAYCGGDDSIAREVISDIDQAPVSEKMKALLEIADMVRVSGTAVTKDAVEKAKEKGASDLEIHDTVLIAALFCMYNRYVDGLATSLPPQSSYYDALGERLKTRGYMRLKEGYDHIKKQNNEASAH